MTRKRPAVRSKSRRDAAYGICTTIQVRNVRRSVKRVLTARAAAAGISLSAYLRAELEALAALPSEAEIRVKLEEAIAVEPRESSARSIRAARAERLEFIRPPKTR